MPYFVYILQCAGGSLYTGSTNNVAKRLASHRAGTGAKYTRSFRPEKIIFTKKFRSKSVALRYESVIKKMSRTQKQALVTKTSA